MPFNVVPAGYGVLAQDEGLSWRLSTPLNLKQKNLFFKLLKKTFLTKKRTHVFQEFRNEKKYKSKLRRSNFLKLFSSNVLYPTVKHRLWEILVPLLSFKPLLTKSLTPFISQSLTDVINSNIFFTYSVLASTIPNYYKLNTKIFKTKKSYDKLKIYVSNYNIEFNSFSKTRPKKSRNYSTPLRLYDFFSFVSGGSKILAPIYQIAPINSFFTSSFMNDASRRISGHESQILPILFNFKSFSFFRAFDTYLFPYNYTFPMGNYFFDYFNYTSEDEQSDFDVFDVYVQEIGSLDGDLTTDVLTEKDATSVSMDDIPTDYIDGTLSDSSSLIEETTYLQIEETERDLWHPFSFSEGKSEDSDFYIEEFYESNLSTNLEESIDSETFDLYDPFEVLEYMEESEGEDYTPESFFLNFSERDGYEAYLANYFDEFELNPNIDFPPSTSLSAASPQWNRKYTRLDKLPNRRSLYYRRYLSLLKNKNDLFKFSGAQNFNYDYFALDFDLENSATQGINLQFETDFIEE
jgi:hypothetical protein